MQACDLTNLHETQSYRGQKNMTMGTLSRYAPYGRAARPAWEARARLATAVPFRDPRTPLWPRRALARNLRRWW